jgi:hypothetical protein
MAAQFAGSRSLDERRRRRLATESEDVAPEVVAAPLPRRLPATKAPVKVRGPSHFPLRKVISARRWKHAGLAFLGLLLAGGILAGGWAAETHAEKLGPGFVRLFDLSAGRLVRWYVSWALVLGSQLAALIWWLRSQSLQDFNGRYRGWACCAALGLIAAFAIQTDAFQAWSATIAWLWGADLRNKYLLSWIVPVIFCGIPTWRFLHQEMRDCRVSLTLLWLTVLLSAGLAAFVVFRPSAAPTLSVRLVHCGVAMLAAQCLTLSLLFQARHAIYISIEPPADRPAWFVALWRRYRGAGKRSRKSSASSESTVSASARRRRKPKPRRDRAAESPSKEAAETACPEAPIAKLPTRAEKRQLRRSA